LPAIYTLSLHDALPISFDGFAGQALGDEASEAVQVNKVGEFEAVTEGSTGGENRIPQAQRANFYAEVNGASGAHFVKKDNTKARSEEHTSELQSRFDLV